MVKAILNKIQKYSVKSYCKENNNKIGIKLYSNIGIWLYIKADITTNIIQYKIHDKITWSLLNINDFYKIFVRKRFEFIKLGNNKPKELKNIKSVYSVKFVDYKIQIFVKENDLYICFPKYSYNIYHISCCLFQITEFQAIIFWCKRINR